MTNKSFQRFAASALAIAALGTAAVSVTNSQVAQAYTIEELQGRTFFVAHSEPFSSFEAIEAFFKGAADIMDRYTDIGGADVVYKPVDFTDDSKGVVAILRVGLTGPSADVESERSRLAAYMAEADKAAAASWASQPAPRPISRPVPPQHSASQSNVYRLYHEGLKVHLYTTDTNEATVLQGRGWTYEGISWKSERQKGQNVYRMYHPDLKVHLYTKDTNEYRVLAGRGWRQEGVAYRSHGTVPIYRMYNPDLKKHLYTKDRNEYTVLAGRGWKQEGIAWYSQP